MSRRSIQLISVLLALLLLTTAATFALAAPSAQDATATTEATAEATAEATVEATAETTTTVEATAEATATVEATTETPAAGVACEQDYVIQADDWLSKLADKFYGDVLAYPAIFEATNAAAKADSSYATIANADLIEPGWKVCVPSAADAQTLLGGVVAPAETTSPAATAEATTPVVTSTVEATTTVEVAPTAEATPLPTAEPTQAAQPANPDIPAGKGVLVMLNCRGDVINVDVIPVGIFQELAPKTGPDCQPGAPITLDPGQYTLKASIAGQPSQGESAIEIVAGQVLEFSWQ